MGEPGEMPRLVAVDAPEQAPAAAAQRAAPEAKGPRSSRLTLLLGVGLAICLVLLAAQTQRVGALGDRVRELETRLEVAETTVARYQAHHARLRSFVSDLTADLTARLQALEALASEDPGAPAEPAASADGGAPL